MVNLTPYQCRVARAALNWTYNDIQRYSGFDRMRIHRFEAGTRIPNADVVASTLRKLFESAGLRFREDGISYPPEWTYDA